MKMKHLISFVFIVLTAVFVCGFTGLVIGSGIGANTPYEHFCKNENNVETCGSTPSFVYRGVAGYEAGGLLGLHIGVPIGLIVGIYLSNKYRKKKLAVVDK
jgi:hypothetical protein